VTAHDLILDLFSRPQSGVASNMRFITERQFNWLKDLIGADDEGSAVTGGMNGGLVWMPSGRWKYVLTFEPGSGKRSIMKLASVAPSAAGSLFG
jgi:hypothetical protein